MNHTTELYFESHITIDPVLDDDRLDFLKSLAKPHGFRVAELLMRKGGKHEADSFMTLREVTWPRIRMSTVLMILLLQQHGFHVRRYKIENTLIDSRIEDVEGLIDGHQNA